ncbi:hypothetical protein EC604_14215 [Paenibacillus amylolyticus]|uniref:DUF1129 domain-containing protein n=1 Tax=Paenibacillus amylolyticus TaxID=1451 RepID=A0A5M9WTK8_PAEAM|nr:hypothetical protein [Paenibacillus amylolyticus]KAA8784997.1 hypothetical protein EC604_14215 [Paenibacillus amylolyticus]
MGISYKKLKEIQNRQITEMSRMTPDNVKLYNQISTIARQAPADEKTQEEWILAAGKAIVQAQKDNKSARELYGSDLQQDIYTQLGLSQSDTYAQSGASTGKDSIRENRSGSVHPEKNQGYRKQHSQSAGGSKKNIKASIAQSADHSDTPEPVKRTPKWYVMIAWAAISVVLFIQGCAGLFFSLTDGDTEAFEHISLFSLIIAAVGGIALVEMLRRLAERPDDQGADKHVMPKINVRGIIIYIVVVVLVLFVGYPLRDKLPVFYMAPWVSAVIGMVGLVLIRPLFGQKKQA